MSTPLEDMQHEYDTEVAEQLGYAKGRDYEAAGFESPEEYMDGLELFSDDDNTIFEAGWRGGYEAAMRTVKKWYETEGYTF